MKIPHNIHDTKRLNKLRELKNEVSDSTDIFKEKVSSVLRNPVKTRKNLSKQQKDEMYTKILQDNASHEIPLNNDDNVPMVSIIIKSNNKKYLSNLLNSFSSISSYYSNYEILILHNFKDDFDATNYQHLPIKFINCNDNSLSYLYSEASVKAKGDYLLFLDEDTTPLNGFLNHMMNTMQEKENVGVVGARLIYPDLNTHKYKSYKLQHEGIYFKELNNIIEPFNKNDEEEYYSCCDDAQEVVAVSSTAFLIKKTVFDEIRGFNENYLEYYSDIDLCLRLHKEGYVNYYNPQAMLYHFDVLISDLEVYEMDKRIFTKQWNAYLARKLLKDKLNSNYLFSTKPLTVGFVVTQSDDNTTAGDYFTAVTLAHNLEDLGWNVKFLSQKHSKNQKNWYYLDEDIDVLISLLDRYNLHKIQSNKKSLIKIAWIRNWFERWADLPYLDEYDIILSSSKKSCKYIEDIVDKKVYLYPLATDNSLFNDKVASNEDYECDYCFTGSYWGYPREIISCLNPDSLKYKFNLYGANWNQVSKLTKYNKNFIHYEDIPQIYASTKIVLDDANHVTKEWGSVNSRVFDAFTSGKLVLTNGTLGNEELFEGKIPEYHSEEELTNQINYFMSNPDKTNAIIKDIQEIILDKHTYKHRAIKLKSILNYYIHKYID